MNLIVLDFMLPKLPNEVEMVRYKTSLGGSNQMKLSDGTVVNISKEGIRKMKGRFFTISRTRIFGVPYEIRDKENNKASIEISIYGNFIFGPLALLAISLVAAFHKKNVEFRFNLGVASFFLALLNIAFFYVHKF